jgi:hypothetical protein
MPEAEANPRTPTLDLAIGLGRFRWSDAIEDLPEHIPSARWTKNKEIHPHKKVLYVPDLVELLPGLEIPAAIDRDEATGTHVLRVMMDSWHFDDHSDEEVWSALGALCARLGSEPVKLPARNAIAWRHGDAKVELSTIDTDDWKEACLRIERPLAPPST